MSERIEIKRDDIEEGLHHERELLRKQDEMYTAQNALNRYVAHMRVLYEVPEGWRLKDWLQGFEPAGEIEEAQHGH